MLLKRLIKKNKPLIKYAFKGHQENFITTNSFVIDLDMYLANAKKVITLAKKNNIKMFYVSRTFGAIPIVAKELEKLGFSGAVVSNYHEYQVLKKNHLKISHVGAISQFSYQIIPELISDNVEYFNVYSLEKIRHINDIAKKQNKMINLILKVVDLEKDIVNDNQAGGFSIDQLSKVITSIKRLSNVKIKGLMTHPCFVYSWEFKEEVPTQNFYTLIKAQEILKQSGITDLDLIMTMSDSITTLNSLGRIKGSIPQGMNFILNNPTKNPKYDQNPGIIFVSEISHNFNNKAYAFAGGYYYESNAVNLMVGNSFNNYHLYQVESIKNKNTDYFLKLDRSAKSGSTVIMAFPNEIFITRANTFVVSGLQKNQPKILGVYNPYGQKINK